MTSSGWHRKDRALDAERKRQYNSREHKAHRAQMKRDVEAGVAYCWRCGRWIPPGTAFHVGHDDWDRSVIRGPEHASCNVRGAASKGARIVNARKQGQAAAAPRRASRQW